MICSLRDPITLLGIRSHHQAKAARLGWQVNRHTRQELVKGSAGDRRSALIISRR
jgi:hypothetical protein